MILIMVWEGFRSMSESYMHDVFNCLPGPGLCEGDCDEDSDCKGDLICYQLSTR